MDSSVADKRLVILRALVASVQQGLHREYYIAVVGYYIESIPYAATGVSVNQHTPPDIDLTPESLRLTAFFRPDELDPAIVRANGIIQQHVGNQALDLVPVRLEVKLDDIWTVAEFVRGEQRDLFRDTEILKTRLRSFPPDQ